MMFDRLLKSINKSKEEKQQWLILVVDDNDVDRQLIKSILLKQGYRVSEARNGQEALDQVEAQRPDLVVLDADMPILNGPMTCLKLKSLEATRTLPVMFLTGVDTPSNVIECFEVDVDDYLSKPVNAKVLLSHVDMLLKEYASSAVTKD